MWNSPHSPSKRGRRFSLADLSALMLPLDEVFYLSKTNPVAEVVDEVILKRLEKGEFIFALYQVLEALLEEVAVPEKGHTGIHEAMVAELLSQAYARVCVELDEPDFGHSARKAAWQSIDRLLIHRDPKNPSVPWILEDVGWKLSDPQSYRSEKLSHEVWTELLTGENFLWGEFLWDDDWRIDSVMDAHPGKAEAVALLAGMDLNVVQALAHTPGEAEFRMAEHYISNLILRAEEMHPDTEGEVF